MKTYTVSAILGKERRTKTIHADSEMDAMFQAIKHVLDKAYQNYGSPWESGHIILSDSEGRTLHTMDASR